MNNITSNFACFYFQENGWKFPIKYYHACEDKIEVAT